MNVSSLGGALFLTKMRMTEKWGGGERVERDRESEQERTSCRREELPVFQPESNSQFSTCYFICVHGHNVYIHH
jgi:hypothetical protein